MPDVILALQPTQRDPSRVMVRVGAEGAGRKGRVAATLPGAVVSDLKLRVGMAWDESLAGRIEHERGDDRCFRAAARRLGRRAMSAAMLRDKLRQLEHAPDAIDRTIARLDKLGLLDDEAFARAIIRETTRSKPAGPRLLSLKLRQKKVSPEVVERVLRELHPDEDEAFTQALAFGRKRAASMRRLAPEVMRRRLYGQLARRGLSPDLCRRVLEAVAKEE